RRGAAPPAGLSAAGPRHELDVPDRPGGFRAPGVAGDERPGAGAAARPHGRLVGPRDARPRPARAGTVVPVSLRRLATRRRATADPGPAARPLHLLLARGSQPAHGRGDLPAPEVGHHRA